MNGRRTRWPVIVAALAMATPAWSDGADRSGPELMRATQRLQAAIAAEQQASADLATLRASGHASLHEIAEFEAFLDGLRQRVTTQRLEVARIRTGAPPRAGLENRAEASPSGFGDEPTPTDEERRSGLDGELDASIGEFDEMLLREQDKLAARIRPESATGAAGGGAAAAAGSGEAGDPSDGEWAQSGEAGEGEATAATTYPYEQPAESGMKPLPPAGPTSPGEPGDTRVANAPSAEERQGARGGAGLPPDIPDGRDDDVVARQLREAAENEADPVLREKLWDEYRKYKRANR